jgi:hypothetical protein
MKKLELNQMENLEGGKFWGWDKDRGAPIGPCINGTQVYEIYYYVLGFAVDSDLIIGSC